MLHEMAPENYAHGGRSRSPAPANPDPKQIVLVYLAAMEALDINAAEAMLAAGFRMTFPGTKPISSIQELIGWAKGRYRFVQKANEKVEAFHEGDCAVVYVSGTLSGEWPDGEAFTGIRFIDRFEVKGGKLTRQDVWNDIAEERQK